MDCRLVRFPGCFYLRDSNRFGFPPKIGTSDSIVLVVDVCLPNHRSTYYTAADTTVTFTTHERVSSLITHQPYFAREHAVHGPQPGRLPPSTSWVTAMCRRIESDELIRIDFLAWIESNRNYCWRIVMLLCLRLSNEHVVILLKTYYTCHYVLSRTIYYYPQNLPVLTQGRRMPLLVYY